MKIEIDQEKVEESTRFFAGYLDGEKDNNGNTQLDQFLEVALQMGAFWAIYFSGGSVKISEEDE